MIWAVTAPPRVCIIWKPEPWTQPRHSNVRYRHLNRWLNACPLSMAFKSHVWKYWKGIKNRIFSKGDTGEVLTCVILGCGIIRQPPAFLLTLGLLTESSSQVCSGVAMRCEQPVSCASYRDTKSRKEAKLGGEEWPPSITITGQHWSKYRSDNSIFGARVHVDPQLASCPRSCGHHVSPGSKMQP